MLQEDFLGESCTLPTCLYSKSKAVFSSNCSTDMPGHSEYQAVLHGVDKASCLFLAQLRDPQDEPRETPVQQKQSLAKLLCLGIQSVNQSEKQNPKPVC